MCRFVKKMKSMHYTCKSSNLFESKDSSLNISQVGRLEGIAENLLGFTKVKLLGFQDNSLKRTTL